MTLEDLRISMQNFMPSWVEIETDEDGEVIIRTGMTIDEYGQLMEID